MPFTQHPTMSAANASSAAMTRPERASGLLTLAAMLVAIVLANSPLKPIYDAVHHTPVGLSVGTWQIDRPLILWINEGLLVFFFVLVALEIKREVLVGHLASRARAALPLAAAVGGMVVPAALYLVFNGQDAAAARGWPIPMATDTVLALAALHALGARVPGAVVAFLTASAIFDDLGAIAVLALLFSESISLPALLAAVAATLALLLLNRLGISRLSAYLLAGLALWAAVLASGVHATVAGFIIGLAVPLRTRGPARSPLRALEQGLRPWVALVIVPVFALFNAGIRLVDLAPGAVSVAVVAGTVAALVIGKPAGILGAAWLASRLGLAQRPPGVQWRHIAGAALLAGIGFTMSLFFAGLAFGPRDALTASATLGVMLGSLLSAGAGLAFLIGTSGRPDRRSRSLSNAVAGAATKDPR